MINVLLMKGFVKKWYFWKMIDCDRKNCIKIVIILFLLLIYYVILIND